MPNVRMLKFFQKFFQGSFISFSAKMFLKIIKVGIIRCRYYVNLAGLFFGKKVRPKFKPHLKRKLRAYKFTVFSYRQTAVF